MIALRFLSPNLLRCLANSAAPIERGRASTGGWPASAPPTVAAQFLPLDPNIVSDAIPAFFIGRNKEGFWVARDANRQIGGIFLLESSAVSFAKRNSWPAGCVTIFPSEPIELDLENKGSPLIAQLGSFDPPREASTEAIGRLLR